jgi:uncharacterized protein YciI
MFLPKIRGLAQTAIIAPTQDQMVQDWNPQDLARLQQLSGQGQIICTGFKTTVEG